MPLSSLLLLLALAPQTPQQDRPSINLTQYIASIHWDPAKSGPLIAIEADKLYINDEGPNDLSGFEQKMLKAGSLSVIAQNWTIGLDEENLPNAYEQLSNDEKIVYLLATLSQSNLQKLTSEGLAPKELQGDQRGMLLSMIPHPLTYQQGQAKGGGYNSHEQPITLPDDQLDSVRLQFRKGVQVMYDARTTGPGRRNYSNLSSLSYSGPDGTPVVRSGNAFRFPGNDNPFPGQVVESFEKKSDLSWNDPRLTKPVSIKTGTIGDLVGEVRDQTGLEIYVDARVANLTLNCYGDHVSARDLLHGIALALGGAIRQVGPAYVIAANPEGEATRTTRLAARGALGRASIKAQIAQWHAAMAKLHLPDALPFPGDDSLTATAIPSQALATPDNDWKSNWTPLNQLPQEIQGAIANEEASRKPTPNRGELIPDLEGKVRLTPVMGYRFVLPDGRPLESHPFNPGNSAVSAGALTSNAPSILPIDPSGTTVAIRSDDARTVLAACANLKALKVPEIWLDSESHSAIQAAVSSGLKVDLVVHPWDVLQAERCPEPDRTVVGMVGAELNEVDQAGFDPSTGLLTTYKTTYAPTSAGLTDHWGRLEALATEKGVHGVIVTDLRPLGYQQPPKQFQGRGTVWINGAPVEPALVDQVPAVFQFGYTPQLRLQFLRKYQMDPIDVTEPNRSPIGPPAPYFDRAPLGPRRFNRYPNVHFPRVGGQMDTNLLQNWQQLRYSALDEKLNQFLTDLSQKVKTLSLENDMPDGRRFALWSVSPYAPQQDPANKTFVQVVSLAPSNSEDADGNLIAKPDFSPKVPICFDLRTIPPGRLSAYLQYMFKPSPAAKQ